MHVEIVNEICSPRYIKGTAASCYSQYMSHSSRRVLVFPGRYRQTALRDDAACRKTSRVKPLVESQKCHP